MKKSLAFLCGLHASVALATESAASQLNRLFSISKIHGPLTKRVPNLPSGKIRGVNVGGWLVSEPWMMGDEWKKTIGDSIS